MFWHRLVSATRFAFQACSFNHSDMCLRRLATSLRKSRRNYVNAIALDEKGDEPEDDGDQVISGSPMDQTSRGSPLDATPQPLSLDEAKELIRLCETGRLHEVEVWIAAG